MKGFIYPALLLLASLLPLQEAMSTAPDCMPFVGERMDFSVSWEFINGGSAHMEVLPLGTNGYRITSTARSNKFLDMFHKVRDRMLSEGECVRGRMQSTIFDIKQQESTYHSSKHADFLWRQNRVIYSLNNNVESFNVPAGHLNVIDTFFATRLMSLEVGKTVRIPLFDARKRYELVVKVLRKEQLRAPWGKRVECLVIEPKLKTAGIFSSRGKVKVWLTNDSQHIPLRMTAKLKFGRIIANLKHYEKVK